MGSCNSGDPIAEDRIHTDITTCNTEEPQQKYRLGTVSYRLLGRGVTGSEPHPLLPQLFYLKKKI